MFIDSIDEPMLVKASVNGKPGFMVLPTGEVSDEIVFSSEAALASWVLKLALLVADFDDAPTYEEWLEG